MVHENEVKSNHRDIVKDYPIQVDIEQGGGCSAFSNKLATLQFSENIHFIPF